MTKEEALAFDLALEALESCGAGHITDGGNQWHDEKLVDKAITAIKQSRSAPVQEPVAWNTGVPPLYPEMKDGETISVEYTTPPAAQRQWVNLTDAEVSSLMREFPDHLTWGIARAIEAKLEEKNT